MRRRDALRSIAGLTVVGACAGCASLTRQTITESFESGLDGWERKAHIGPEVELAEFTWTVETSDEHASEGSQSVRITNEGDFDDGTTWIERELDVESGRRYRATVTAEFWSASESFNILRNAVMRLGPEPATAEEDFPDPGGNTSQLGRTPYGGLREPLHLSDGWREYRFEWESDRIETTTLHLALGTTVVWETEATHFLDAVSVQLRPIEE